MLLRLIKGITAIAILDLSVGLIFALAPTASWSEEPKAPVSEGKPAQITTPITVRGRATDTGGKPVAGATIYPDVPHISL